MIRTQIRSGDRIFTAELDQGYVDISVQQLGGSGRARWVASLRWHPAGYFDNDQLGDVLALTGYAGVWTARQLELALAEAAGITRS